VFVQQAGAWQHRLVVQLVGQEVDTFARQLAGRPPRLLLREAAGTAALLVGAAQAWPAAATRCLLRVSATPGSPDLCQDAAASIAQLLQPHALVECGGPMPKDVCVSLVRSAQVALEIGDMLQTCEAV
jgi:hypothetical protein